MAKGEMWYFDEMSTDKHEKKIHRFIAPFGEFTATMLIEIPIVSHFMFTKNK